MAAKIIQFLDQSTLRDSLIQAGGQRMTTFSWDKTAALTLHLYQELGR
jgi:hypothetical protein